MNVLLAYSRDVELSAYGPIMVIDKLPRAALHHEILLQHIEAGNKLQRVSAYAELLAVDKMMMTGFQTSLSIFAPWDHCMLRPVQRDEFRIKLPSGRGFAIWNETTGRDSPELPDGKAVSRRLCIG